MRAYEKPVLTKRQLLSAVTAAGGSGGGGGIPINGPGGNNGQVPR